MPETLTSGKPPRSLIPPCCLEATSPLFTEGPSFSYRFFNKDTFLSETPIMSCFLSAQPWEFCYNVVWRPAGFCALP